MTEQLEVVVKVSQKSIELPEGIAFVNNLSGFV